MKSYPRIVIAVFLGTFVLACNLHTKEKEKDEKIDGVSIENRSYSIDATAALLEWTAYKFTEKIAVQGTFDDFSLDTQKEQAFIEGLLKRSKIIISTQSVNSGDPLRDAKLRTYFFEVFKSDVIRGEIIDAESGKGKMNLELNAISREVTYSYWLEGDTLFLTTSINLTQWEGDEAIQTLNQECYELHMGVDKISKLWPNVTITMKLPFKTNYPLN